VGEIVNPASIAAIIIVVPLAVALVGAMWSDVGTSLRDKADGVVVTWAGLRLSRTELILGSEPAATRIPLAGLHAAVTTTGDPPTQVHLTIDGHGDAIYRSRAYSYGASTDARKLAMLLNMFAREPYTAQAHSDLHRAA